MCGIVGGYSNRDIVPFLLAGLKHLEYRGYDSAGIAVLQKKGSFQVEKVVGKINELEELLIKKPISGFSGVGHTRWATHGKPVLKNAHPIVVGERVILVHNGIIENFHVLKEKYSKKGYRFSSETDSELIACAIYDKLTKGTDLLSALQQSLLELEGAYALCVMDVQEPDRIIGAKLGPPLILGIGEEEFFIASDILAFPLFINNFIYLEDGDVLDIKDKKYKIHNSNHSEERKILQRNYNPEKASKNNYPHFMLKEIFEQPSVVFDTIQVGVSQNKIDEQSFGMLAPKVFDNTQRVQIVACGSSYHAGLVARVWLESIANVPCQVEFASEFRYRVRAEPEKNTLFVLISQSGETADTLAALKTVSSKNYSGVLGICNVENSSLARETELMFLTPSGIEIGVCATKTFSTQLVALMLLTLALARRNKIDPKQSLDFINDLKNIPSLIDKTLTLSEEIKNAAHYFAPKRHALFLGRGLMFPIAQEAALKLKEISYIHAEAYPAGELKHGPLALVDKDMPVIVLAPNNKLLDKLKSNMQEVEARSGELIVFTAESCNIQFKEAKYIFNLPEVRDEFSPFIFTVALQLLSYYVGVLKGADVDQPRNLAKSVTVE